MMFGRKITWVATFFVLFFSVFILENPVVPVQAASNDILRFESYNMPGYCIRHAYSRGRMDTEISPYQDAQFRLVAGLADVGCVSFQSVNFPNSYLRHRNGEIWLDANDGSSLFKADASWIQRPGLADSSWVSFESYNYPGNYIRHRDFLLYNTAISTDLDRRDATFKIWNFNWSWIRGAVFVPTNVVNEIQQWDEYNPAVNDRELYYASIYGINCVRVYLHYLVWVKDKTRLLNNIEDFLTRANSYGIKTEFVFFDDCWDDHPVIGPPYPAPIFGVHNSRWVECPGDDIKGNYSAYKTNLQAYVQDVVNAHKYDSRIAFWEPYNEPGNGESGTMYDVTNQILRDSRQWIKSTGTTIPITSCDFDNTVAPAVSDFYSFHAYDSGYSGPRGVNVLNTECMNRQGQSVPGVDNAYYHQGTGYIIWEAGIGRDNCRYPWGNTNTEPAAPFHGVIYPDGHPWSLDDVKAIRNDDLSNAPVFNVEYFAANNFTNFKKVSVTPLIDFDLGAEFGTGSPDASVGIGVDNFSIRWTGTVLPASSGTYTFYADGDNIIRVWVGGTQVINKTGGGRSEVSGAISLNANQSYDFKVEYVHGTGDSSLHIRWSGPNLSKQILKGRRNGGVNNTYFMLVNRASGKCMDLIGGNTANGAVINQWTYDYNGPNQRWQILPVENGHYRIISWVSGKCACVSGDSLNDGAQILNWDYVGGNPSQQWDFIHIGNGWFKIRNVWSGKCLDVDGGSTADNAKIQQWTDNGGAAQQWRLQPWGDYYIKADSGKYVCVENCGSTNGYRIIQYQFETNPWFKWRFENVGDGWYKVSSLNALSRCIDVSGVSTEPGADCILWDYLGGGNQKVRIEPKPSGRFKFYFQHDGMTWDIPGGQTGNNVPLEQYSDNSNPWQEFTLERVQ